MSQIFCNNDMRDQNVAVTSNTLHALNIYIKQTLIFPELG